MKIIIDTIPHKEQRYNTVGDWYPDQLTTKLPDGSSVVESILRIRVSQLPANAPAGAPAWKCEALVAVHELIEAVLCMNDNIIPKQVDDFDRAFTGSDPGDDPTAPYKRQHCTATGIERLLASLMGVDWLTYDEVLTKLTIPAPEKR